MDPKKYINLLVDVVKEQGTKYEDLSNDDQKKLLLLIPEMHRYICDRVKETLDLKNE